MPETPIVPIPDNWFWYLLATALSGILIWVIARYVNKTDNNFTLLTSIVDALKDQGKDLKAMLMLHEHRLNGHDEDIKTLENGYLVRYRKTKKPD